MTRRFLCCCIPFSNAIERLTYHARSILMKHIIFAIILAASFALLGWNLRRLYRYLRVGKPEDRFGGVWHRIGTVLKVAIGQSKLLREPLAGAVHAAIFWGFL